MTWSARTSPIQVGDAVAYSKQWLQSTGQLTGDVPQARGKVTGTESVGGLVLADVEWDHPDMPARVNVKNLSRVRDGVVVDRD